MGNTKDRHLPDPLPIGGRGLEIVVFSLVVAIVVLLIGGPLAALTLAMPFDPGHPLHLDGFRISILSICLTLTGFLSTQIGRETGPYSFLITRLRPQVRSGVTSDLTQYLGELISYLLLHRKYDPTGIKSSITVLLSARDQAHLSAPRITFRLFASCGAGVILEIPDATPVLQRFAGRRGLDALYRRIMKSPTASVEIIIQPPGTISGHEKVDLYERFAWVPDGSWSLTDFR